MASHTNDSRPPCRIPSCPKPAVAVFTVDGSPELKDVHVCGDHWPGFKTFSGWTLSYAEIDLDADDQLRRPRTLLLVPAEQKLARKASRRQALEREPHPIYGTDLVAERLALFDYCRGDFEGSRVELVSSADLLYLRLQEWLRGRLAIPLNQEECAWYEADVLFLRRAFGADEKRGKSRAKRHELDICPDPLTVCIGSQAKGQDPDLGIYYAPVEGCGRVIPETKHRGPGGTLHLLWCEDCAPDRHPHRAKQALAERRAFMLGLTG